MPGKRKRRRHIESNHRRLEHTAEPVTARLRYVCEFLFAGSAFDMASELGVCYRHFYTVYDGRCKVSVRMAAQIIAKLNIRAEWLLNGTGPMFATDISETRFCLSPNIRSSFRLKTPTAFSQSKPAAEISACDEPVAPNYAELAQLVFAARVAKAPVILLLGATLHRYGPEAAELLRANFVSFVGLTLRAVKQDARPALCSNELELNSVARFAAATGRGYGEAVAAKLHGPRSSWKKELSVVVATRDMSLPVATLVEFGEIDEHFGPTHAGAELGAAVGAAAYVDQLVLADYLQRSAENDKTVIICVGEVARWLAFLQRYDSFAGSIVLSGGQEIALPGHVSWRTVFVDNGPIVFFRELLVAAQAACAAGEMIGDSCVECDF